MIKKMFFLAIVVALVLSGCNLPGMAAPTPTADVNLIITAAAATAFAELTRVEGLASPTPLATETSTSTPEPPTPTATLEVKVEPVDAQCTYPATVRSWPGKGGEDFGFVGYERTVQVLARNDNGNWYYINWADSPNGKGWVTTQAFNLKGDISKLPIALETGDGQVVYVPPLTWVITGTPLPLPTLFASLELRPATVIETVTLRVCPNKACMALGYLQPGEQVSMVGRFGENKWALIEYPSGPDGKAWISRDSIQPSSEAFGGLPYYNALGTPITPEPPTPTPDPNQSPTPTPTATAAPVGPLVEITDVTTVYTLMSSLSPVLGTLNAKDRVHITAQSLNKLYYEIQYPDNTDGRGYISAKYVRLLPGQDYRYLHYTDANGTPIPTP
jgi:hypothetical protein